MTPDQIEILNRLNTLLDEVSANPLMVLLVDNSELVKE